MKFLFCMILLVLTVTSVIADDQNQFLIGEANCRVVNPNPRENERITWSGSCKDGYADGTGVLQWYIDDKNVSSFEGQLERGRPNGVGTYSYGNKVRYEGNFLLGEQSGKGKIFYNDGASYIGEFKNNRRSGEGDMTYNDGVRYVGTFLNNKREGRGICNYVGGAMYDGEWKNDMRHGDGYMKYSDGGQYEGDFKYGNRDGRGVLLYLDGSRYEGGWKADKHDGTGSKTYSLGGRYDGEWLKGKFHGKGTFVYAHGRRVEGEFRNGKKLEISNDKIQAADIYAFSHANLSASTEDLPSSAIMDVPFGQSYEQLTPEHKMILKSMYPLMEENDEPPYPINGTKKIYDSLKNAHSNLIRAGNTDNENLYMHVAVDSEGNPETVKVFGKFSAKITQVATFVVMKEKYKPGKCAGEPCAMIFPFSIKFTSK